VKIRDEGRRKPNTRNKGKDLSDEALGEVSPRKEQKRCGLRRGERLRGKMKQNVMGGQRPRNSELETYHW